MTIELPQRNPFRTGDAVKHKPSGETWLVAYCERGYVCCCGWPESRDPVADCEMHREGTDAECLELLRKMAEPSREGDSRKAYALRILRGGTMAFPMATDSLGFPLKVTILISDGVTGGRHVTHEDENGKVPKDATHEIIINSSLTDAEFAEISAHEAYHLLYSVRHLITADEEIECEVFGQLVKHLWKARAEWAAAGRNLTNPEDGPHDKEDR